MFHKIVVGRGADVPAYVENGIADIGITGRIQFLNVIARLGSTIAGFADRNLPNFCCWFGRQKEPED